MIRINPSKISGTLHAPASKAHAQRLLFMASMPAYPTRIKNVPRCNDIDSTIACLESLGCIISRNSTGDEVVVKPFPKTSPMPDVALNFRDSATTARLAMALCASLGINADCRASGTLVKRKMIQLTGRLALRGVTFSNFSLPFVLSGRMASGEYSFTGDEGTQAISAIMMFAPCLLSDSQIKFESELIDNGMAELTRLSMEKFQMSVVPTEDGYFIPGRQYYQSPEEIRTENDWGLAAMWITAAAASGHEGAGLSVDNLPKNSPQLYRDLDNINALIYHKFTDITIDASKMPNLATLYAALAIVQGASIRITGVPQLKVKEADRLAVMAEIARKFGQKAETFYDGIQITGNGLPFFPTEPVDCQGDPWVFMSMCLACVKADKPILLMDEHGAEKIYRDFLDDFKSLGGSFEIYQD